VVVALAASVAVVSTTVVNVAARTGAPAATPNEAGAAEVVEADPSVVPTTVVPAAARPTRVLFVGDSLLHQARPLLDSRLSELGMVTWWVGGAGEGPLSDQLAWIDEVRRAVAEFHPDHLVLEACCNYPGGGGGWLRLLDRTYVVPDAPQMDELWLQATGTIVDLVDVPTDLVLVPPPRPDGMWTELQPRIERLRAGYARLAGADTRVQLVDWAPVVLAVEARTGASIRHVDGLHLSPAGNDLVVASTLDALLAPRPVVR